jgi:hypothetical protein
VWQLFEFGATQSLMATRGAEMELYTAAVAVRASRYAAPVLRLPQAVNRVQRRLRVLATCASSSGPRKRTKLSKLARQVGDSFRSAIGKSLLSAIEGLPPNASVKLITDAPLELLPIDDLPLGIRFTCTRIPVTPGNLLMSLALGSAPLLIEVAQLSKVLVISAFHKDDPVRGFLRAGILKYMSVAMKNLDISWVDVDGTDSFCKALSSFDGPLVVFDGHGGYSRDLARCTLLLGDEETDVWSLKGKVRVPPIVFLSACETHPMDGGHATTVNAFLRLGARSVVGSLLPIDSRHAATLAGRFLFRLADYLSAWQKTATDPLRWSDFVTGMLRMSYVTDLLIGLQETSLRQQLSNDKFSDIHKAANILIIGSHPRWFDKNLAIIATTAGVSMTHLKQARLSHAFFGPTQHYAHFGNAEEIIVIPSGTLDVAELAAKRVPEK